MEILFKGNGEGVYGVVGDSNGVAGDYTGITLLAGCLFGMEKKMETTKVYWGYIGLHWVILGLFWVIYWVILGEWKRKWKLLFRVYVVVQGA